MYACRINPEYFGGRMWTVPEAEEGKLKLVTEGCNTIIVSTYIIITKLYHLLLCFIAVYVY